MQHQDLRTEPDLDEALEDSIVHAVMASDLVTMEELRAMLEAARRKLLVDTAYLAA
jgi:hypothetical protein